MLPPDPEIRQEHQAGVIEHGAVPFGHVIQLLRKVSKLAHVETCNALVSGGIVVMRCAVVALLDIQKRIVHRGKIAGDNQRCDAGLVRR